MIRYKITPAKLKAAISQKDANWFEKAKKVLKSLPAKPTSKQFKSLWGDIKQVWMQLQGSKCMYCESLIEGEISNDVEHFRPKANVSVWKVPTTFVAEGVKVSASASPKGDPGYRNLAYQPWNYAASCKQCNSVLKKNFFPIAGKRNSAGKNPRTMKGEKALFVYPIGDLDDNPEKLIRFVGMHPEPRARKGTHNYHRALVMIEVFQLNNAETRKELFRARVLLLQLMFNSLRNFHHGADAATRSNGADWIKSLTSVNSPHTSCMRCFKLLYQADENRAARLIDDAKYFYENGSLASPAQT